MGLHEVVLGVLGFFFYWSLIFSWAPGVFCGGKGFDDFCLCSIVKLHAMQFPVPPGIQSIQDLSPVVPEGLWSGVFLDKGGALKLHTYILATKRKEIQR